MLSASSLFRIGRQHRCCDSRNRRRPPNAEWRSNASGDVAVPDTYRGTTNTSRTISLSDTYDWFRLTAVWSGSGVSVGESLPASGPGPSFSSSDLIAIQIYSALNANDVLGDCALAIGFSRATGIFYGVYSGTAVSLKT